MKLIAFLLLTVLTCSVFVVGDTSATFIDTEYTSISSITAKAQKKAKVLPVAASINGTALKIALPPPKISSGNNTPGGNTPIMPPPITPVDAVPIYHDAPSPIPAIDGDGKLPIAIDSPAPTTGDPLVPPTDGDAPVPPTDGDTPVPPTDGDVPVPPTDGDAPVPPTDGDAPAASDTGAETGAGASTDTSGDNGGDAGGDNGGNAGGDTETGGANPE